MLRLTQLTRAVSNAWHSMAKERDEQLDIHALKELLNRLKPYTIEGAYETFTDKREIQRYDSTRFNEEILERDLRPDESDWFTCRHQAYARPGSIHHYLDIALGPKITCKEEIRQSAHSRFLNLRDREDSPVTLF